MRHVVPAVDLAAAGTSPRWCGTPRDGAGIAEDASGRAARHVAQLRAAILLGELALEVAAGAEILRPQPPALAARELRVAVAEDVAVVARRAQPRPVGAGRRIVGRDVLAAAVRVAGESHAIVRR